ncbi:MAG: hypothetical protein R3264_14235 [Anaerolineae bacterium]|nr:hypothetical protein [Anaerolineae bacterium]
MAPTEIATSLPTVISTVTATSTPIETATATPVPPITPPPTPPPTPLPTVPPPPVPPVLPPSEPLINVIYLPMIVYQPPVFPDLIVESITATNQSITVVIKNQGEGPVNDAFWVDVYINPDSIPDKVNQHWHHLGEKGAVWGVTALPLAPGETRTLTIGDSAYHPELSNFVPPLSKGSLVYAQVDSVNLETDYGGVLEGHEVDGGIYNNILHTISVPGEADISLSSLVGLVTTTSLPAR